MSAKTSLLRSFNADFDALASAQPQARAILEAKTGRNWSYEALHLVVVSLAASFHEKGVKSGSRVISLLPNSVEQFAAMLAAWRLGADFCPVSPLSTPKEILRFTKLCGGALALVPERLDAGLVRELSAACALKTTFPFVLDGDLTRFQTGAVSPASKTAGRLIVFTSGTAADPKAVVINGDRLWSSAKAWAAHHQFLNDEARFYNILPMSYLGGLFNLGLIPMACGGSFVLSDAFSAVTAVRFWAEVSAHGVNVLWFAPTMLRILSRLQKPGAPAPSAAKQVKAAFLGMAPTTLAEKERFEQWLGFPLMENFALSETTFLTSENLDGGPRTPGSAGAPLPWAELRFRKSEGVSEIMVRTPFLFEGYLDSSGKIELPQVDGFFPTGDFGEMDPSGALVVKGRGRDIIKKGGYLLVLRELEEVAQSHPRVQEAAAVGVPHELYGENALLFVRLAPDGGNPEDDLADIAKHMKTNLAKFKWPGEIACMPELPGQRGVKLQKRKILEAFESQKPGLACLTVR